MAKSVRDLMSANPICVSADTTVSEAARLMRDNDIGNVVVERGGQLYGIVTDRDIVVRAVAENRNPESTKLEAISSENVVSVSPDETADRAVQLMRERAIRRLPVVENGRVVGVVSLGDLAVEMDSRSALGHISAAAGN